MARLPQPGQDAGTWGTLLNDYLSQSHTPDGLLKDDSVGEAQLKDNAVTSAQLADDAVTAAAIQDGSIAEAQLTSAVLTKLNNPTLADGSVTNAKVAVGAAIDADKLADGTTNKVFTAAEKGKLAGLSTISIPAGIYMPNRNALDRWKAARAGSNSARADVLFFGDSTAHGQTNNGDSAASANNRPVAQYLRANVVAAGFADGGVGLRGWNAAAGMSGTDGIAHIVSSTGGVWTSGTSGFYGGLFNNSICTSTATGTNTASLTIQGKGRFLRITEVTNVANFSTATGYASWNYSVDGAGSVAITAPTGANGRRARTHTIDMGGVAGGSHTVTITLTSDGTFEMVAAWVNATGIAFHTLALPGQQLNARFDAATGVLIQTYPFFGLGNDQVVAEAITGNKTGPWAPALAILHMGLNEQILGSTDQATALTSQAKMRQSLGVFAELCRTADVDGIVCVPQFLFATNFRQYSGLYRSALVDTALSYGLPVADLQIPLGNAKSSYNVGVHLTAAGYQAQADWLWSNLLSV